MKVDRPHRWDHTVPELGTEPAAFSGATLLLLAGGASRRMGTPKAQLPVGAGTLLDWVHGRLAGGFAEVLVAAGEQSGLPAGLRRIPDLRPGEGPLAGIEAGLRAASHPAVLVVACDMPRVTPALLMRLLSASEGVDAAVPRTPAARSEPGVPAGWRPEPTCACYRRTALPAISAALDAGRRKAAAVLGGMRVRWLDDLDPDLFWSINTPSDYQLFRSAL